MRLRSVLLIGPVLPLCGCNLFRLAGHNVANEVITRHDERRFDHRLEDEARCVWKDVCAQYPARTLTPEFADGFTDGYVDYLDVGGTPRPPAVPPLRYRRSSYLTPHGHALVKDYLVGFQYGAEVAVATGKREFLTVPVLLSEPKLESPLNTQRLPAPPEASLDAPGSVPRPPAVAVPIAPPTPVPVPSAPPPEPPKGALPPVPAVPVPPAPTPEAGKVSSELPPLSEFKLPAMPELEALPPVPLPPVADPGR